MADDAIPSFTPNREPPDFKSFDSLEEANKAQQGFDSDLARDTVFQCVGNFSTGKGCGEFSKVSETTYVQTHFYISPHGCTGGDYWKQGEGVVVCPKCWRRNRLYSSPALTRLRPYFREIVDEYKD